MTSLLSCEQMFCTAQNTIWYLSFHVNIVPYAENRIAAYYNVINNLFIVFIYKVIFIGTYVEMEEAKGLSFFMHQLNY